MGPMRGSTRISSKNTDDTSDGIGFVPYGVRERSASSRVLQNSSKNLAGPVTRPIVPVLHTAQTRYHPTYRRYFCWRYELNRASAPCQEPDEFPSAITTPFTGFGR